MEFFEMYRLSFPAEFSQICETLSSQNGPVVAIVVRTEDAVACLRKLCGPHRPEDARKSNPQSLRAQFGKTLAENAVHCTDLEEDGSIECEYFFSLLKANKNFVR